MGELEGIGPPHPTELEAVISKAEKEMRKTGISDSLEIEGIIVAPLVFEPPKSGPAILSSDGQSARTEPES